MRCATVDGCCGFTNLRNGTYFVGLFWTIFTLVFFITNTVAAASAGTGEEAGFALVATCAGLVLVSCLLLIYGVYQEKLVLIKIWIIVFAVLAVLNAAAIPVAAICFLHWEIGVVISALFATVVGVVIVIYCLIVVNSYYREIAQTRAVLDVPFYVVADEPYSPMPKPRF